MFVRLAGKIIEDRLLQPEKAYPPMLVRLAGKVIEDRLLQYRKAPFPMLVRLAGAGKVIEDRRSQT